MEIKVEGGLDALHPKKTVKKKYGKKKNRNIRQKSLSKLITKPPLQPQEEDLDTKSSDDHNQLGYYADDEDRLPESETVLNVTSNNFQTEDGNNGTICQKTLNNFTNNTPLVEPEAPSTMIKIILPEEDLDTKSSNDHNECIGDQLGDSSSDDDDDDDDYEVPPAWGWEPKELDEEEEVEDEEYLSEDSKLQKAEQAEYRKAAQRMYDRENIIAPWDRHRFG